MKLRGSLLIYILAATLDPLREIRELATELVLKYTLEKNEGFMRNCLLECPFVFNGCPCFGQSTIARTYSENILRGSGKKASRELIYRYLIRKTDAAYLYNYFGNMARLAEHVEKSRNLKKSADEKAAVVDFLFICTEICLANVKHKRAVDKIIKDTQNGEKSSLPVDIDQEMADAEAAAAAEAGVGKSTRANQTRGRKNQPTLAQALLAVERVIPHIVQIAEMLTKIDGKLFDPIVDKMCVEMCAHFEAMFEYAQPREFWGKYNALAAKAVPATSSRRTQNRFTSDGATTSDNRKSSSNKNDKNRTNEPIAGPSTSTATVEQSVDKNDSGQFTMDVDSEDRSVTSKATTVTNKLMTPTGRSSMSSRQQRTPSGRLSHGSTALDIWLTRKDRRTQIDNDGESDNESIVSSVSAKSMASQRSTSSRVTKPQFVRKRRKY